MKNATEDCGICAEDPLRCARHPRLEPKTRRRLLARAARVARSAAGVRRLIAIGGTLLTLADVDAADALAARLRLSADGRHCYDCGAAFPEWEPGEFTTGYAVLRGEKPAERDVRTCYPCTDRRQRADFAKADSFSCYLTKTADGRKILSTWTGGELAHVTCSWERSVGFGRWRGNTRTYFNATAPDGAKWFGTSPGFGMYARARRSKGAK